MLLGDSFLIKEKSSLNCIFRNFRFVLFNMNMLGDEIFYAVMLIPLRKVKMWLCN